MLIATDLDGTLVRRDSTTLTLRSADVLRRLDRAGVPVIFVTGRPLRWMTGFWPHVGGHGVAIVSNGAIAYDVHRAEVITFSGIDPDPGLDLVATVTEAVPGATFAIECLDGIRQDPSFANSHRAPDGSPRGTLEDIWDVPAVKLLVRHPVMNHEQFRERVMDAVSDRATATWSVAGLVEISANGVTKATALIEICERLGVTPGDVIAFGDMPNDIPMLAWAGMSYAVQNAHESVLAVADHVAPRGEDDGVARVLESILADELSPT